ncbi:MAG: hypothetical protein JRH20_04185 [Deltaproteobacteria bacterium]|nr:hypothetical protein [Deltaproteobacteria bacterium]
MLRTISKENVARLLKGRTYRSSRAMRQAERLVNKLRLKPIHNTSTTMERSQSPLLSTHWLEQTGLGSGANSRAFNKDFLASEDNVHFFATFATPKSSVKTVVSEYGEFAATMKRRFTRNRGWVSAFVMYPGDLHRIARHLAPKEHREILENFKATAAKRQYEEYVKYGRLDWQHVTAQLDPWTSVREQLHKLDFTVPDFEKLVKRHLLFELSQLRLSNPTAFRRALRELETGHVDSWVHKSSLLKRFVFDPLGMPEHYELKVPVAVPSSAHLPLSSTK